MRTLKNNKGKNFWDLFEFIPGQMNAVFTFKGVKRGLHFHHQQHETFVILSGRFRALVDGRESILNPGDSLEVQPRMWHGLEALEDGWFVYYQKSKFDPNDEEVKEWL